MATSDEVIEVTEVRKSPRGRKPEYEHPELLETLAALPKGKAIALRKTYGEVPASDRQKVGAQIRKHWTGAHGEGVKCKIDFSPEGVAQVRYA